MEYFVTDATKTVKKLVSVTDKKCVPERCSVVFGIPEPYLKLERYLCAFDEYVDVDDPAMLPDSAKLRAIDVRGSMIGQLVTDCGSVSNLSQASTVPVDDLSAGYVILIFFFRYVPFSIQCWSVTFHMLTLSANQMYIISV